MLKDHFNIDASKLTLKEFKEMFAGNVILSRYKIDVVEAFKQLGGKITSSKKKYKSSFND